MLPRINNKDLIDCSIEDLEVLLQNQDYRENQYLDYKETFAFLRVPKDIIPQKIAEFRNDICSFANAEGGYILYGISDDNGMAREIIGVEIHDPDAFELDLRNKLYPIMPKVPPLRVRPIMLEGEFYVVIIKIEHDVYAPYLHLEDQKNYKIFKRDGNQKTVIGYAELKNMFIQSRILDEEILEFRKKRISYYKSIYCDKKEMFMLFHIIPESFLSDSKALFIMERVGHKRFGAIFQESGIDPVSFPCVDGLRFQSYGGAKEGILYNNGILEFYFPLTEYIFQAKSGLALYKDEIWRCVDVVSQGYQSMIPVEFGRQRYFGCISIIGCKGIISEDSAFPGEETLVDRDEIICRVIPFADMEEMDSFYCDLSRLHLEFLLSIGIKRNTIINELINKIF